MDKQLFIDYCMRFVGIPYRWGGSEPLLGFDCSGFVQEVLAAFNMDPPGDQTAQSLFDYFKTKGQLAVKQTGSLVFYGKSVKEITHVTIMLNDKMAIGANSGGSTTTDLRSAAMNKAFVKLRAFDYRKDVVAIVYPNYM